MKLKKIQIYFFFLVLIFICLLGICYGAGSPGASWTAEETEIIYKKVMYLYFDHKKNNIIKEMKKLGHDSKDYTPNTNFPSAAKVISLYSCPNFPIPNLAKHSLVWAITKLFFISCSTYIRF